MIVDAAAQEPMISILMPSYGYGDLIGAAVTSALAQSHRRLEVVVQDGGSHDSTTSVLDVLGARDGRLKWQSRPDNGQSDALNLALHRAEGSWVGWLNADEFYLPGALSHIVDVIRQNPEADVVYGDFYETDIDGCGTRLVCQHGMGHLALRRSCFIPTCTTFIRKEVLKGDPWDPRCMSMMDWDLFLQLAKEGRKFVHTPVPISGFRTHPGQVTRRPEAQSPDEFRLIRERHGLATSALGTRLNNFLGRTEHVIRKFANAGYVREYRAGKTLTREPLDARYRNVPD